MIRGLLSTVFAILLIGSVVAGQCAACGSAPVRPAAPSSHDCCHKKPAAPVKSHCGGTPSPAAPACTLHEQAAAFDKTSAIDAPVELPAVASAAPIVAAPSWAFRPALSPTPLHSPPPLFVLHASFLI